MPRKNPPILSINDLKAVVKDGLKASVAGLDRRLKSFARTELARRRASGNARKVQKVEVIEQVITPVEDIA